MSKESMIKEKAIHDMWRRLLLGSAASPWYENEYGQFRRRDFEC